MPNKHQTLILIIILLSYTLFSNPSDIIPPATKTKTVSRDTVKRISAKTDSSIKKGLSIKDSTRKDTMKVKSVKKDSLHRDTVKQNSPKLKMVPADSVKKKSVALSDTLKHSLTYKDTVTPATIKQFVLKKDSINRDSVRNSSSIPIDTAYLEKPGFVDTTVMRDSLKAMGLLNKSDSLIKKMFLGEPEVKPSTSTLHPAIKKDHVKKRFWISVVFKKYRHQITHYIKGLFFVILIITVILILVWWFLKKRNDNRFLTSARLSVMDTEVQLACSYIEKNFKETGLSLESISIALTTGPSFLDALFIQELGMSVHDFIMYVRIHHAKLLARQIDLSRDQILKLTGFSDYTLFLYTFMEITKVAYDDYRESLIHGESKIVQ